MYRNAMEETIAGEGESAKECDVEDDKAIQVVIFLTNDDLHNIF